MARMTDDEIRAALANTERDPDTYSVAEVVDRATRPHHASTYLNRSKEN